MPTTVCLTPKIHHVLMVHLETMRFAYIDVQTCQKIKDTQIDIHGPVTFAASHKEKLAGWYYLLQYDPHTGCYSCSCLEAKTQGYCQHLRDVELPTVIVA